MVFVRLYFKIKLDYILININQKKIICQWKSLYFQFKIMNELNEQQLQEIDERI